MGLEEQPTEFFYQIPQKVVIKNKYGERVLHEAVRESVQAESYLLQKQNLPVLVNWYLKSPIKIYELDCVMSIHLLLD